MTVFAEVKRILERVRDTIGRDVAVQIIFEHGNADRLSEIDATLFDHVYRKAEEALNTSDGISGRLKRAADLLIVNRHAFSRAMELAMSATDDLRKAVDGAVNEMGRAADFIRNHPASQNDPELAAFASRLKAASDALGGVDVDQVVATGGTDGSAGTVSQGSTDTGSGTVTS